MLKFLHISIRCRTYVKNKHAMRAIINRNSTFGTLDGVIMKNDEIRRVVAQHLKQGTAMLLIDSEETLMYSITESNIHPALQQAIKPFIP